MKKVFTNKMVSHVWAQQTQEEGRNSSKSLFFENETIYSYGYHFPIAKFIPGTSYVLFNTDFYTKTTRLHQNLVRRAISSDYQFNLPNSIWDNHYDVYQYYLNKANELVKNYRRKSHSTLEHNESELEEIKNKWLDYCGVYNYDCTNSSPINVELPSDWHEVIKKKKRKERLRLANQKNKDRKDRAKYIKEAIYAFRNDLYNNRGFHGIGLLYYEPNINTMIRLKPNHKDTIETSRGAEFPLKHGEIAFKKIQNCKESETNYRRNGPSIRCGHFTIDSIDSKGNVKAGCHNIKYKEIKRFAQEQGWL